MRITDIFLVLPTVPLMIVLTATLKPSIWNVSLAIGLTSWTQTARIVRSQTLTVKERVYVHRARTLGCSNTRIISKYILPAALPLVIAQFILSINFAIASEAFLSFLGLGDLSQISWGSILFFAFSFGAFTIGAYWYFLPPGICIIVTILAFTAVSQGLDEIFNPRLRKIY
jgi:peptide/nickel transport system permease protein